MLELADRGPFWCYHVAEHHFTPPGMAPSPSVYLSALIQRTERIRLGSMVHLFPLYHPLRLIEEVCMLDHMSGGRLEVGFGKGISPFELGHYGTQFIHARAVMQEVLDMLIAGLRNDVLHHDGRHYQFPGVPMELRPLQQPNPPLWYGTSLNPPDREPKIGAFRMTFVAQSDAAAERKAREAYPVFYRSLQKLWIDNNTVATQFPPDYDQLAANDTFIVGSPETVREEAERFFAQTGCHYLFVEPVWGSISQEESLESLGLFGGAVAGLITI